MSGNPTSKAMKTSTQSVLPAVRRKPLTAGVAALFALAAPEAFAANTWPVTSCADSGAGSLRAVIASPTTLSGDTVDLSGLSICGSSISLTTGAIVVAQHGLILQGPSGGHAVVTGYYYGTRHIEFDRVFTHIGTGTLSLNYLYVSDGNLSTGAAEGGCIYSKGSVLLNHSRVYDCKATNTTFSNGRGGGIYTAGSLTVKYSQISGNSLSGQSAFGGGAFAHGGFNASNSTISGNTSATSGGGIFAYGVTNVNNSTISGNVAASDAGGLYVNALSGGDTLTITDSTISGNIAQNGVTGGVRTRLATTVQNSTIAFNTAATGLFSPGRYAAPGLSVRNAFIGSATSIAVTLQSSIISNNTYGNTEVDVSTENDQSSDSITISGSGNLIRAALGPVRPITTTACPLLGPLNFNGGLTATHALLSHSPAIDAGNNAAGLVNDQRGPGYPRVDHGAADIGAYEVQQGDIIFNAGFEGCPVLF